MKAPLACAGKIIPGQFLGVTAPLADARFAVLLLPFEKTTSHRKGTRLGPSRLIEGSLGLELFDEELGLQTYKAGIHTLSLPPSGRGAAGYFPMVRAEVSRLIGKGKTVFSVGGEHSLSQATIPPHIERWPGLSVLHFDAHADLRPTYEGSPHNHACALYPAFALSRCPGRHPPWLKKRPTSWERASRPFSCTSTATSALTEGARSPTNTVLSLHRPRRVRLSVMPGGHRSPAVSSDDRPRPSAPVVRAKKVVGRRHHGASPPPDDVSSELAASKLMYRLMG